MAEVVVSREDVALDPAAVAPRRPVRDGARQGVRYRAVDDPVDRAPARELGDEGPVGAQVAPHALQRGIQRSDVLEDEQANHEIEALCELGPKLDCIDHELLVVGARGRLGQLPGVDVESDIANTLGAKVERYRRMPPGPDVEDLHTG